MESTTEILKRKVERCRKELETAVDLKEAADTTVEHFLASYRSASEDLIFHNYAESSSLSTEKYLWNWHTRVNARFRKNLKRFQEGDGKKKVVERRKSEKQYISFIKSSQAFYRGFIQRLASHFANVEEVVEVACKLASSPLSVDRVTALDAVQKQQALQSCHSSLIQLGDLSRYRETASPSQARNWGPAKGYYMLANTVLPSSGAAYHQLAVIAQADQDTLGTTYWFYRALMQPEPHLNARANLEKHFKKTRELWDDPRSHNMKDGRFENFRSRFVAFHAKCYSGVMFDEHKDLETELIHEITVTLLQRPDTALLSRICLTNIAAEATALERLGSKCSNCLACQQNCLASSCSQYTFSLESFHLLQSFNIKVASQLLEVLGAELHRIEKLIESNEIHDSEKLTPVVRCLLPVLRQYSSWLLAEVPFLVILDAQANTVETCIGQPEAANSIQALWRIYVSALAALATIYPLKGGKKLNYLLAEDEDTIAFNPFADDLVRSRYLNEAGKLKARSTDQCVSKDDPVEEMLHRVRQIVRDGLIIAKNTQKERIVPVRLSEGRFIYIEPESSLDKANSRSQLTASDVPAGSVTGIQALRQAPEQAPSLVNVDSVMQDMVDDLVEEKRHLRIESERFTQPNDSSSARNEPFTIDDLNRRVQQSSQYQLAHPRPTPSAAGVFGITPTSSGLQASAATSGSARPSQLLDTPAHHSRASTDQYFTNLLTKQQQEIQARSSPQKSLPVPSSWSTYETPTGFTSLFNAQISPVWSPSASGISGREKIQEPLAPRKNLFGAIGETPGRTPTSAQPD